MPPQEAMPLPRPPNPHMRESFARQAGRLCISAERLQIATSSPR